MTAPCGHQACSESPAAVLDHHLTLTANLVAYVLELYVKKGKHEGLPARRQALDLMKSGALLVVDPTQPVHRFSVSVAEIQRYIREGARKEAETINLRSAS